MYRALWALHLYIASNVSCPLGIASVYRVKCIAPFGHCVCISRQMNRALWTLRLYISLNVSCHLGIASLYRVNSCLGRRQQLSVYPVECLHGEGGCGGVSTRVHHLQLGLVSRHPLRALGGLQLLPYAGKPWRERGIHLK